MRRYSAFVEVIKIFVITIRETTYGTVRIGFS